MRFLILESHLPQWGRGVRGRSLYWFLKTYFGRRAVRICTCDQLLAGGPQSADVVFVGLPTPLGPEHLARLDYGQLALFDLTDNNELMWGESDRDLLLSLTDRYFKAWVDDRWDFPLTMCMAPVRRPSRLSRHVGWDAFINRNEPLERRRREIDVAFLGTPTRPAETARDERTPYHQRVEWLLEIRQQAPDWKFWGGLVNSPLRSEVEQQFGNLDELFLPRRIRFGQYFNALKRSKVLLTPRGMAPWTYRHYEAIYAGATIVTTDLRPIRMLAPLPTDNMIHVADHEPVVPAIEQALELRERRPEIIRTNRDFVEQYLRHGGYSRRRPELLERFLAQLEPVGVRHPTATAVVVPGASGSVLCRGLQ